MRTGSASQRSRTWTSCSSSQIREKVDADPFRGTRNLKNAKPSVDPLVLLRGLSFSSKLRSARDFSDALGLAHEYDHPDEEPRDASRDPGRSTLDRATARADIVAMLLQRRFFRADALCDEIEFITVYSDASPVVGGELQGMILDVWRKDGTRDRMVLPGGSLCYSMFDAVSKTVGLLWALWLVCGPEKFVLKYVLSNIGNICTDMGIEVGTLQMPDILDALLGWIGGTNLESLRGLVRHDRRLFGRAVRIAGWSHQMGNVMKQVANSLIDWPRKLEQCRALTHFWKTLPIDITHSER